MPVGKKVVIIGGGIQGCELAEFLVKRNRKVTIVDSADALGTGHDTASETAAFLVVSRKRRCHVCRV